jgi:phosphoribosylformylglycinamidine synthase
VVNCLNFGNPEHPDVMWELSEAIDGMGDACRRLGIPVIGGNVSLYNESRGRDIDPTPVVGVLGLIERLERPPAGIALVDDAVIVLVGDPTADGVGGSRWGAHHGVTGGTLPPLDLDAHRRLLELVRALVGDAVVSAVHDVSDGGLGVALADMAIAGSLGFEVSGIASAAHLFSEAPSRVVVAVSEAALPELAARSAAAGVPVDRIGVAGGQRLVVDGLVELALDDVAGRWAHGPAA